MEHLRLYSSCKKFMSILKMLLKIV